MRRLAIKLILFCALIEGLGRVHFTVLLAAMGVGIAVVVCTDLLLDSASMR